MPSLSSVYIYESSGLPEYNIEEIIKYISKVYPKAKVEKRKEFFSFWQNQNSSFDIDDLAKEITLCRVHNVNQEAKEFSPLPLEIDYEKKRLEGKKALQGLIYDGFKLQVLFQKLLSSGENKLSACHMIFSDQLIASFDEDDKRYHLRVGIYGYPNLISASGLVEALAKPREYYFKIQMGIDPLTAKKEFGDGIIDYDDQRATELLKGYCLQAIFYQITGDPFCGDKGCRLYNAHWQKDALFAQIESGYEFCSRHSKVINNWQKS